MRGSEIYNKIKDAKEKIIRAELLVMQSLSEEERERSEKTLAQVQKDHDLYWNGVFSMLASLEGLEEPLMWLGPDGSLIPFDPSVKLPVNTLVVESVEQPPTKRGRPRKAPSAESQPKRQRNTEPNMVFAERLKELRLERNLSVQQLARAVKVNRFTIYNYEDGIRADPSDEIVERLAVFFQVSKAYLLGESGSR